MTVALIALAVLAAAVVFVWVAVVAIARASGWRDNEP